MPRQLVLSELTERFEDVCGGFIGVLPIRLVAFRALLNPLPLLLVARLASVAPPPVVALGNVHANVHGVVTCHNATQQRELQIRLHSQKEIAH